MSQISWVVPRYIISIIDIVFTNYYFLSMAFSDQFYHWLLLSHHAANSQMYCSHEAWESPNIQKRDRKNSDPTGSQTRATLCTSRACMMLTVDPLHRIINCVSHPSSVSAMLSIEFQTIGTEPTRSEHLKAKVWMTWNILVTHGSARCR